MTGTKLETLDCRNLVGIEQKMHHNIHINDSNSCGTPTINSNDFTIAISLSHLDSTVGYHSSRKSILSRPQRWHRPLQSTVSIYRMTQIHEPTMSHHIIGYCDHAVAFNKNFTPIYIRFRICKLKLWVGIRLKKTRIHVGYRWTNMPCSSTRLGVIILLSGIQILFGARSLSRSKVTANMRWSALLFQGFIASCIRALSAAHFRSGACWPKSDTACYVRTPNRPAHCRISYTSVKLNKINQWSATCGPPVPVPEKFIYTFA